MKTPTKTEYNSVPPPVQFAMRPSVSRPYLQNDALWLWLLRNRNRKPRAGSQTHWPAYTATGSSFDGRRRHIVSRRHRGDALLMMQRFRYIGVRIEHAYCSTVAILY